MTTVEARLTQMREAAARFRASSDRIEISVAEVQAVIDELTLLGYDSAAAQAFTQQNRVLGHWGEVLGQFAAKLDSASEEMEAALTLNGTADPQFSAVAGAYISPIFMTATMLPDGSYRLPPRRPTGRWKRRERPVERTTSPKPTTANQPLEPLYIAAVNRPLYEEWQRAKTAVLAERAELAELQKARVEKLNEIGALKNRVASYDSTADVMQHPRVQMLYGELQGIDTAIATTQQHIEQQQQHIAQLAQRLAYVTPGDGADLKLIAELEKGQTLQIIKDNTQDCVNYIANRMAIPVGLPTDAHLWDENARRFPQYGITIGDQPLEGAVIVMEREHAYADDVFGHVMYVERVENGQAWVTDNKHAEPVLLSSLTDELTGANIKYLYFPWQTKA